MENFVLIPHESQLDHCFAKSRSDAHTTFCSRGWIVGDVMTLDEYQDKLLLNALENESI